MLIAKNEELEPYFLLLDNIPFVVFGFGAEEYSPDVPLLPKGKMCFLCYVIQNLY